MNQKFNSDLAEILQVEASKITLDYKLEASELWDSMAIVSTLALIDEHFGKSVDGSNLGDCTTVQDVYELIKSS